MVAIATGNRKNDRMLRTITWHVVPAQNSIWKWSRMAHMIISQIDAGMAANYRSRDIEWSTFTIIRCQPGHLLTFWSKHHAFDQEVQRSNGRRANLNSHAHSISYDRHMTAKPAWDQKWTCTVDQLSARTAWSACTYLFSNSRRRRFGASTGAYVRMISTENIGRFEQKNMSSSELIWAPQWARRPSFFWGAAPRHMYMNIMSQRATDAA